MLSLSKYTPKQALDECSKFGYDKRIFDDLSIVDINKKNSLISVFNDNIALFTKDGIVNAKTVKIFINKIYDNNVPDDLQDTYNLDNLVALL